MLVYEGSIVEFILNKPIKY